MRVIFAAGGTAGHINPAISIANYIKQKCGDADILFIGAPGGMEVELVKKSGYNFKAIKIRGFQRKINIKNIFKNIDAIYCLLTSHFKARKIIKEFNPDIVIGTGGYVSGPVLMNACKMGYKTAIHEQNAYPGITNKILSKHVDIVFSAVEQARAKFSDECKFYVVGNPIREGLITKTKQQARNELGISDEFCIVSFGGSLGASKINEIAGDVINWHKGTDDIVHIHSFGKLCKGEFPNILKERGINLSGNSNIRVSEYIDNMDTCILASDLVICRAGAITISELQAAGKASILIPSPYVSENHQYHNAMVVAEKAGCIVVKEDEYDKNSFVGLVDDFYKNKLKLEKMSKNASKMAIFDTNEKIYDKIVKLLDN